MSKSPFESTIPAKDVHFARLFSKVSQGLKRVPLLDRLVVGESVVREGWEHIPVAASKLGPWTEFEGDPDGPSSPLPRRYRLAGILRIAKTDLDTLQSEHNGRHAVAVALGEAVVVGALGEGESFGMNPNDPTRYEVALRIGNGALRAVGGLWVPSRQQFMVVRDVEAGARLPVEAVPAHIPIA